MSKDYFPELHALVIEGDDIRRQAVVTMLGTQGVNIVGSLTSLREVNSDLAQYEAFSGGDGLIAEANVIFLGRYLRDYSAASLNDSDSAQILTTLHTRGIAYPAYYAMCSNHLARSVRALVFGCADSLGKGVYAERIGGEFNLRPLKPTADELILGMLRTAVRFLPISQSRN